MNAHVGGCRLLADPREEECELTESSVTEAFAIRSFHYHDFAWILPSPRTDCDGLICLAGCPQQEAECWDPLSRDYCIPSLLIRSACLLPPSVQHTPREPLSRLLKQQLAVLSDSSGGGPYCSSRHTLKQMDMLLNLPSRDPACFSRCASPSSSQVRIAPPCLPLGKGEVGCSTASRAILTACRQAARPGPISQRTTAQRPLLTKVRHCGVLGDQQLGILWGQKDRPTAWGLLALRGLASEVIRLRFLVVM